MSKALKAKSSPAKSGPQAKPKAPAKIALSQSANIPFDKLRLADSNVRRIKQGVSIESLADDIAHRTLLQSINVREVFDHNGISTGTYEIPAGGRRYRALELLVKDKRMAKDTLVPCVIRTEGLAEEDSLAENMHREHLHPLDQFRAFKTLIDKGVSEAEIAARFFVAPSVVKQRLRLANVAWELHNTYADDDMTLEQLMEPARLARRHLDQARQRLARVEDRRPHALGLRQDPSLTCQRGSGAALTFLL